MRQRRWMELLEEYRCPINYYPRKANMVADALSRKAEHRRSAGLLQPLPVPEWKWDHVTIDFVTGLPRTRGYKDAIWVIVDRLTKVAHYIAISMTYLLEKLVQIYVDEIVRLHGVPIDIVLDRDPRDLEFSVGDRVFLKLMPHCGKPRCPRGGKLSPRYVGPFEIINRIGKVAYQLALPSELIGTHDVFHVSQSKKYHPALDHVLNDDQLELRTDLSHEEKLAEIIKRSVKELRGRQIPMCKVVWRHYGIEETTWETKEYLKKKYPELLGV
ncbi:hypothetical protein M9H77_06438 [Catharanthus roseus]|uniref:Uncharacterized protein n=1 Tax=Catharanthus roseus TaxID=4058 RepID=A0ACC0BS40_CATRO|nr:hypothetical protein M9H77_06438 [Catharanthus roseus]